MDFFNRQYESKKKVREQIKLEKNPEKVQEIQKNHAVEFFDDKLAM